MPPTLPPLAAEAVRLLQALLRFDTSNPPGNERPAADYIAGVLTADGIAPTVIETAPGRGNVVARLRGDGTAAPLLLFSHLDVVPVERAQWTVDPFGGEIRAGYVYGRGALDMKGIGAMQLAVFLDLARQAAAGAITLKRDLILAATADEETNANQGIGLLAASHPELLRAEYALTEFGGFPMRVAGKTFYPIQTAEKGTAWITLRARGTPGHASVPRDDNAVVVLARAVERLGAARLPMRLTATARAHIAGLADALGGPAAVALRAALSGEPMFPELADRILQGSALAAELHAVTHNTVTPTGLRAGFMTNVVPSSAEATLDCRTLPGDTAADVIAEMRRALGDAAAGLEFQLDSDSPGLEFPTDTPLMTTIHEVLRQHDPHGIPIPYMLTGATDARHVAALGAICYGFSPMSFESDEAFSDLMHGHDERISLKGIDWGTQALRDVVLRTVSAP
ncbi:MAG: M20/M25/M40 family metallo-hydrolase [Anaerolineae bacterium]|nr:M20/M25/M40 family metallo-hydrolase [Anaerolineae bacterium]